MVSTPGDWARNGAGRRLSGQSQRRHWEPHMLGSVTAPLNTGVETAATMARPQLQCTLRPWKGASDNGKLTLVL